MLKLSQTICSKYFFVFAILIIGASLFLSFLALYYTFTFLELFLLIVLTMGINFFIIFYIFKKQNKKIVSDSDEVINYLKEILDKNYEAVIKTKYFSEFLQIEILLKNIVKRLHKRDNKK